MTSNFFITLAIIIVTLILGYIFSMNLKEIICMFTKKHYHNHKCIYIQDVIFDRLNDNDDLDDTPTVIKVEYCGYCGHIFNITREGSEDQLASWSEIKRFEQLSGCKAEKLTLAEIEI